MDSKTIICIAITVTTVVVIVWIVKQNRTEGFGGGGHGGGGHGGGGHGGGGHVGGGGNWRGGGGRGRWRGGGGYGGGYGGYDSWDYPYYYTLPVYATGPNCVDAGRNSVCPPDRPNKCGINTIGLGVDQWQCCSGECE